MSNVGRVKFSEEIPSIKKEVQRLRTSEGVKIIIALGHSGIEMDMKIAQEVEGVDVVVGGHTHTFLYSGKSYYHCVLYVPILMNLREYSFDIKVSIDFHNRGSTGCRKCDWPLSRLREATQYWKENTRRPGIP